MTPTQTTHPARTAVRLFTLVIGTAFSALAAQAQVTVFSEGFESPAWAVGAALTGTAINHWTGTDNGTTLTAEVSNTKAHSGTQSLYLYDNLNGGSASAVYDFGTTLTQGYVEFSVQRTITGGGTYVYFRDAGSGTNNFSIAISSAISLYNSAGTLIATETDLPSIGYTTSSDWYTFRITFDETDNTASVSINGTSIAALSISSGQADAVKWEAGRIQITAGSSSATNVAAYIDDISVVNTAAAIPEPATCAALVGLSVLGAAFCHRRRRS